MGALLCRLLGFFCSNSGCRLVADSSIWYNGAASLDSCTESPLMMAIPSSSSSSSLLSDYLNNRIVFDTVLENFEQTETLYLVDSDTNNNTLVRNCYIHDTDLDGILLRNVQNIVVVNCTLENIGGSAAIRGSAEGSTRNVLLYNNTIRNVQQNGLSFAQRVDSDGVAVVDQVGLYIVGNDISNTGLRVGSNGLTHGMYVQAQDFFIYNNTISGIRNGNGISVRSSGVVSCNVVKDGTSKSNKPSIRYYSDHQVGPSNRLIVTKNLIDEEEHGMIDLYPPAERYDGEEDRLDHVVKEFEITNNVFVKPRDDDEEEYIRVGCEYEENVFTLVIQDNTIPTTV